MPPGMGQPLAQDSVTPTPTSSDKAYTSHPLADALVHWFTEHGGQLSDDVQVGFSDSRGFHMRAVRSLKTPGVVTCPLNLTLSCLNLDPNQKEVPHIDSPLQQCQGKIPEHILTYLLLIEQRKTGWESPWHAYISCLPGPESMTTPLWFDEDDLAFVVGTSLAPAARERRKEYQQQWEHALSVLQSAGIALADEFTLDTLLWAATIFTSRAFISTHILPDRDTVPILFPVVDLLNHSGSAKVEWDFQPHTSFTLKLLEGDTFKPGQELFNNYAPKQNDELLLGYGFCLEDNPIEQFPLKLAFPPMLQKHALEAGLFMPQSIPFGMNTDFLSGDPNTQQHFLRAKDHPFGRYTNNVTFFRGIPPYIVHFFFVQTVLSLELASQCEDIEHPGPRITLQVLALLHQAIEQRSQTLPLSTTQQPRNDKQRYAKMYRDGQAKIIHSVRLELQAAIDFVRAPAGQVPLTHGALITPTEALAALATELSSSQSQRFKSGLATHSLANESLVWTLLLVCFVAYSLTDAYHDDSLIKAWLRTFYTRYSLPDLEDGIEDAETYTFVAEHLSDFIMLQHDDGATDVMDMVDDIGAAMRPVAQKEPALIHGKTENLSARLVMWAMKVVEQEVLSVREDAVVRQCIYVEPYGVDETARYEAWMYTEPQ